MKLFHTFYTLLLRNRLSSVKTLTYDCLYQNTKCISIYYQNNNNNNRWGTKKKHRNIKLNIYHKEMTDPKSEEILAPLRANVKEQVL